MKILKVLFVMGFLVLQACHYKNLKNVENSGGNSGLATEVLDFAFVMKEVIGPKCLECHSSPGGNAGGLNLETYTAVFTHRLAIQDTVADDYMPKRRTPLTARQKEILRAWIAADAPEHAKAVLPNPGGTPAPAPSPTPVAEVPPLPPARDWLTVRTLVIEPSCLRCHSAPANRGGINLETYQNVQSELALVDAVIRDGSMPIRSTLTPEQKELILDWIQAGAPEFARP